MNCSKTASNVPSAQKLVSLGAIEVETLAKNGSEKLFSFWLFSRWVVCHCSTTLLTFCSPKRTTLSKHVDLKKKIAFVVSLVSRFIKFRRFEVYTPSLNPSKQFVEKNGLCPACYLHTCVVVNVLVPVALKILNFSLVSGLQARNPVDILSKMITLLKSMTNRLHINAFRRYKLFVSVETRGVDLKSSEFFESRH